MVVVAAGCGSSGGGGSSSKAQGLWLPNYGGNTITEFTGSTLKTSSTPTADLTNSGAGLNEPWDTAFDKKGNLWVSNYNDNTIAEYTASQLKNLKTTPAPAANVVISESGSGPSGLLFDKSGNLWVAYWTAGEIVEFTPSQLTASGSPAPNITISSSSFNNPSALQFTKSGDLWVANTGGDNVLWFTASQVAAGGSQTPFLTIATGTIGADYAIAFDHSGNLWVTNFGSSTVQEFAANSLTGTGTITPTATVTLSATSVTTSTGTAQSLDGPDGLAFDHSGDLWVANWSSDYSGSLAEFTPKQLAATGSPSPTVFLDSDTNGTNISNPILFTFGPSIK